VASFDLNLRVCVFCLVLCVSVPYVMRLCVHVLDLVTGKT